MKNRRRERRRWTAGLAVTAMVTAAVAAAPAAAGGRSDGARGQDDAASEGQRQPAAERIVRNRFAVAPTAGAIEVDGVLDEAAWEAATVVPITHEWFPGDNVAPPVDTECLLTFDDERLYVAFRAFDPDPSRIRAHLADRDTAFDDDTVGFQIDPFNDRRRAFEFRSNPLGVQLEATVSDVDDTVDWSWDAIWDSAGKITAEGYVVEMAIPFRQLRFPRSHEVQTWGFLATREYPRSVLHQLRSTIRDRDLDCQVCQFDSLTGFQRLEIGHNLEVVPTVTGARTDARESLDGPLESGDEDLEAGLSVRWGLTPNVTFNAAVNPDFSQVEADVAQLDVNERFALFFPEKRPFFLEGADLFSTPLQAVFTRTVADPDFGLKLTGKEGKNAFGVFVAQDRINNLIFPSFESSGLTTIDQDVLSGVARYRRDLGATSTLGLLWAGREADDYSNHVFGVDGSLRPTASDTVRFQLLGSSSRYPDPVAAANDQPPGSFDGYAWRVDYSHAVRDWLVSATVDTRDEDFRADSGFIPRVGVRESTLVLQRIFWGTDETWYSQFRAGGAFQVIENDDGDTLEESGNLVLTYEGPSQSLVELGLRPNRESFRGETFEDFRADLLMSIRPSGSLQFELFLRGGEVIDFVNVRQADFVNVQPSASFRLGRRFSGELSHQYQSFEVDGEEFLAANLTQSTLRYHFNARSFLRAILQYETVERELALYTPGLGLDAEEDDFFTQLLFSYKLNPQTVFLLGYSENRLADDRTPDLTRSDRTVFLKVGYAFLF